MSRSLSLSIATVVFMIIVSAHAYAGGAHLPGTSHVYGKAIDAATKKPVDYASVSILAADHDSLIAGMLTEPNGDFSFDNIPAGSYRIKVTFIGYTTYEKAFTLSSTDTEHELGNLPMQADTKKLSEVTVTGEKAAVTMNVDRKVFNVDKDISSRGGTGLDVMKNIPGVSIDADGNVALRNNTPLVYIDGKPSTLGLDQIPSDEIDRVEVITNPSAKYEAAASGGIINVIMKHNRKPGYNGLVSALIGTNRQWNGTAMTNLHRGKWGFTLSVNTAGANNASLGYNNRTNLNSATGAATSQYNQNTVRDNKRAFETIRAGIDYYINNRNTLSVIENINIGRFSNDIDAAIRSLDAAGTEVSHGTNYNYEGVKRRTYTTMLDFRHQYPHQGKEYTITISYERFRSTTAFLDTGLTYSPSGSLLAGSDGFFAQAIPSGIQSHMVTAQWDFQHPLRDSIKLEYGLRSYYKRANTFANVSTYDDALGSYQPDAALSSQYRTDELINAAYVTVAQQVRHFSYQIGLRFEEVYFRGSLLNKGQTFSYSYPSSPSRLYESFFPSFYLSERINEHHLLQLNATRKTNRPSGGQVNPNLEVIDQRDYTVGNPALRPEFINQGELNYSLTVSRFDWLSSLYLRYTEHPITNYTSIYDTTVNSLLASYINGKGKFSYGWENTFKIIPTKNLNINLSGNVFYTSIQTNPDPVTGAVYSNSGFSWIAKAMVNYKFPLGFAAQVNGSYEAPKVVPQGMNTAVYFFDISASKELGPATINFTLSDVLNSKIHGTEYVTPEFTQHTSRRREVRYAKLGVTFKFGKDDKSARQARKIKKDKENKEEED